MSCGNPCRGGLGNSGYSLTSAKVQKIFESDKRRTCVGESGALPSILRLFSYILTWFSRFWSQKLYESLTKNSGDSHTKHEKHTGGVGAEPPRGGAGGSPPQHKGEGIRVYKYRL